MIKRQIWKKIQNLEYLECKKLGHQTQQLSSICLNSQCKLNRLACCHCQQEQHQLHFIIPLKEYLVHIYQQKMIAIQDNSIKIKGGFDVNQNLGPKQAKYNYLSYIKAIEDRKLLAIKQLHSTKQKIIQQISDLQTQIHINANKYIQKMMLVSKIYFQNTDLILKFINLNKNQAKVQTLLDNFLNNTPPPSVSNINQNPFGSKNIQIKDKKISNLPFEKIAESHKQKIESFSKQLEKFDFNFFPKLFKTLTYQNIQYSVLSTYQWDLLCKSYYFEIMDPDKKIIRVKNLPNQEQRVALMKVQFSNNSKGKFRWAIKISKLNGWVGVGVALKNTVISAKYKFNYGSTGHGMYLISANGYTWSHSQSEENSKSGSFSFLTGDIIILEYNSVSRELLFKKHGSNSFKILKIAQYKDTELLCPCVNMLSKNDEVQIVGVPQVCE